MSFANLPRKRTAPWLRPREVAPDPVPSSFAPGATAACALLLALAVLMPTAAMGQGRDAPCGNPFVNHFGPFDYRTASAATRKLVEDFHFTIGVESMTRPATTMFHEMANDVEYTLRVFPNHHRALITMGRLADRFKRDPPPGTNLTVECWFDRALRFRPDDTVARSLYAQFLQRRNRRDEAVLQLDLAAGEAGESALSLHNIGLVYLEFGEIEKALAQVHRAAALGLTNSRLEAILRSRKLWVDPPPAASAASAPDSAPGQQGATTGKAR
jgi:hypothetical protein